MERADIHPSRDELSGYWKNTLETADGVRISQHLEECEFCSQIIRELEELDRIESEIAIVSPSPRSVAAAQSLFRRLFSGQAIQLDSRDQIQPTDYHLAADGKQSARPAVENLATVFSSEPEIVLKVMRDNRVNRTYLHLIADNPALSSHVLVESLETQRSYVTDGSGQAEIEDFAGFDAASAKWQVKLPSAEFSLKPLVVDPDRVEYENETVLETDRGDKVKLTFEGKASGKQIRLEVLSLEGQTVGEPLVAAISVDEITSAHRGKAGKPIIVNLDKLPTAVQIRIYR
jgi:hypothetical protein